MQRVACKETSDWFRTLHRTHGVTLHKGLRLSHFESEDGLLTSVTMSGGSVIEANTALVGIGISLNDTLAWPFALVVADGVVVGALCQTRDPDIYVVGD